MSEHPEAPSVLTDLDLLENAFTAWLVAYEMVDTGRWHELFSRERHALASIQWKRFREEIETLERIKAKASG